MTKFSESLLERKTEHEQSTPTNKTTASINKFNKIKKSNSIDAGGNLLEVNDVTKISRKISLLGVEEIDRGQWIGPFDFLMSMIAYAVGLGIHIIIFLITRKVP